MQAKETQTARRLGKAERDLVALGIAIAAVILFVGTSGSIMPKIVRAWMGHGAAPDLLLTNAVLLNIALLIFGWRRYSDLQREVRERRSAQEEAQRLATIDPLTGCHNRRSGPSTVAGLIAQAEDQHRSVAVMLIDVDNFKQINDLNGHQMGDKVLVAIANRVSRLLPEDGVLIRLGGDEFACALPHDTDMHDGIARFATAVLAEASQPISCDNLEVETTVSLGLASTDQHRPADGRITAEMLIHRADIAMYHAKKSGRNRLCWFEPTMESELRFRNEIEAAIRRGIGAGEFVPFYEQQIDLETGELVGFEMLARWQSPRYGLVSPDIFIPIAEEIELIADLSECLIRQALNDAKSWSPKLTLSVNISPLQLRDPWFAQKILQLLVESGFPPNRLEIEITESCLHENVGAVRSIVTSLKNQGIHISLDDFGTGYSSLAQLRNLPFDRIKIDRSFISEMAEEKGGAHLVEAIISLGRGLDLPVTAEGVESPEVLAALRGMGTMKGQGYLYGRPEDAEATTQRLASLGLLSAPLGPPTQSDAAPGAQRKAG